MKKILSFSKGNQIEKLLLFMGFVSTTIAVIIARNSLATSYEFSIYSSTPLSVWFLLYLGLSCGIVVSVYSVFTGEKNTNKLGAIGLLLILLVSISIAKMDIIRGYLLYGSGDVFSHVGFIKEILLDGHFHRQGLSIYPIIHIFAIQLYQLLNVELMFILGVIPISFYITFVVFLYLLSRIILHNKGYALIVTLAGLILFHSSIMFSPSGLTYFLFPLFLFIFVKTSMLPKISYKFQFTILFVILLILLTLLHPLESFSFALFLISMLLYNRFAQNKNKYFFIPLKSCYAVNVAVLLVLLVWLITWVSSFYAWDETIKNISFLLTEGGPTKIDAIRDNILYAESHGYSAIEQFFKVYGTLLILGLSSLIVFPLLIKKIKQNTNEKYLYSFFAPALLIAFLFILGYFSNVNHFVRILPLFKIICLLFFGYLIYYILQHRKSDRYLHKICFFGIVFLLLICSIQSFLTIYPSPYLLTANDQVTITNICGMDWFFNLKNNKTNSLTLSIGFERYCEMLLADKSFRRDDTLRQSIIISNHFGYTTNDTLGKRYTKDVYMVLDEKARGLYIDIWPEIAESRFLPSDFERVETDASIDKIYSNNGFDTYLIHSIIDSQDNG